MKSAMEKLPLLLVIVNMRSTELVTSGAFGGPLGSRAVKMKSAPPLPLALFAGV
jgi:hypothetical protein